MKGASLPATGDASTGRRHDWSCAPAGSWRAHLELAFARRGARTVLSGRRHTGPLVVQKPFYPEGAVCHVYLLHPPGGVVGGDQLQIDVAVDGAAEALLTTPAAGKFYRSGGATARQLQRLRVANEAILEWLPQETIVYAAADVESVLQIELAPGARLMAWDILCLGRPAAGEAFTRGCFRQRFEIRRDGRPLLIERAHWSGSHPGLQAPWGLAGYPVSATLVAYLGPEPKAGAWVELARAALEPAVSDTLAAVSMVNDVLVCRCLAREAEAARQVLIAVWSALRAAALARPACVPRIWNT